MRTRELIEADIEATQEQMDAFKGRLDTLYSELDKVEENSVYVEFAKEAMEVVKTIEDVGFTQSEAVQLFCAMAIASNL